MRGRLTGALSALTLLLGLLVAPPAGAHDDQHGPGWHGQSRAEEIAEMFLADSQPAETTSATTGGINCVDGFADVYPCSNVDLLAHLPLNEIGGGKGNDIWGWTYSDPSGVREFAIVGRSTGTSFVEITDPANPIYLGNLPTASRFSSSWRDIKVHANHAFIVSEALNHGMQVFDLTTLLNVASPPDTFSADAHFNGFKTAHNIAINEASGFAYVVGSNQCSGGLYMVDINTPTNPTQAGCFSVDGYTHDVQCVNYAGPDSAHSRKEICFASNEDTLTIVDVTDKSNPVQLARVSYPGAAYTHQGWLTDDHKYFLLDDELDEDRNGHNTHTYVFDVSNVDAPAHVGTYVGTTGAIDHNQYVVDNHTFQANYRAGLRILELTDLATASLTEVGYFDVHPEDDNSDFNGAWSNYPFFASGTVIVSSIEKGLFVLRPNLTGEVNDPPTVDLLAPENGASVSGDSVAIEIAADDLEDPAGDAELTVEWRVDDGAWQPASFDNGTGRYTATWDSNSVDDGDHTITARATDSGGKFATDSHSVTVSNGATGSGTMHVGDLDGVANVKGKSGRWEVLVSITVHDENHNPVANATVTGVWSGDVSGSVSGTTGSDGTVTVSTGNLSGGTDVTFTVTGVAHGTLTYDANANHDEADSDNADGTLITVVKPS